MASSEPLGPLHWFGVRCVFRLGDAMYEERITLWRARSLDHAIELAEDEAARYGAEIDDPAVPIRYAGLAQAYELADEPGPGAEVWSLIRDSRLPPDEYLDRWFDTGDEHEQGG